MIRISTIARTIQPQTVAQKLILRGQIKESYTKTYDLPDYRREARVYQSLTDIEKNRLSNVERTQHITCYRDLRDKFGVSYNELKAISRIHNGGTWKV